MVAHSTVRVALATAIFLGRSAEASLLSGQAFRPNGVTVASLPDENETGLYQPVSFEKTDKKISICTGC
jgi:hypothetical protein